MLPGVKPSLVSLSVSVSLLSLCLFLCCREQDPKRVYYLSMEFLMGRSLLNTLYNLGIKDQYAGQQHGVQGTARSAGQLPYGQSDG